MGEAGFFVDARDVGSGASGVVGDLIVGGAKLLEGRGGKIACFEV